LRNILRIKFLGATQQVTGSCYLLEAGGLRFLIDCGLFQEREYLNRNWDPLPFAADQIDFLLLTHVHLDHSGLIPKLVREGFSGEILTTSASFDMLPIVLLDSARIQEEDASFKRKRHKREGRKGPYPEIPIYTVQDVEHSLPLVKKVPYEKPFFLNNKMSVLFHDAGHILGSAMLQISINEKGRKQNFVFSGDIGQWNKPIVRDPSVFEQMNYVVMESTYGDRNHEDPESIESYLCKIINDTVAAGGNVIVPSFAIERAQELMYYLSLLVRQDRIPFLMIFLDSPMAVNITDIFRQHKECFDKETLKLFQNGNSPFHFPGLRLVRSVEESKAINLIKGSCMVIAGSGMCTGGRIKHHLIQNISRPESTILFIGYQAKGTLGRAIIKGAEKVRIHGRHYPVRAKLEQIQGFSAHADRQGLFKWLSYLNSDPKQIFITHGERKAALSLTRNIREKKGWNVNMPKYLEEWEF